VLRSYCPASRVHVTPAAARLLSFRQEQQPCSIAGITAYSSAPLAILKKRRPAMQGPRGQMAAILLQQVAENHAGQDKPGSTGSDPPQTGYKRVAQIKVDRTPTNPESQQVLFELARRHNRSQTEAPLYRSSSLLSSLD